MIWKQSKTMGKFLSFQKGILTLKCEDKEQKEKLEKLLSIINNHLNTQEWSELDYYKFFKQFTKLEIDTFNNSYEEMLKIINLSLEEAKSRIIELNDKLELHLFDDEREYKPVKEKIIVNGQEKEVTRKQLTITPHEFTPADIVLLFKNLQSKIDSHSNNLFEAYKNKINSYKKIEDKEVEIQLLIDLLSDKDESITKITLTPYLDWFKDLSKDDSIYNYLMSKTSYVISQNNQKLRVRLLVNKKMEVPVRYTKEKMQENNTKKLRNQQRLRKTHL